MHKSRSYRSNGSNKLPKKSGVGKGVQGGDDLVFGARCEEKRKNPFHFAHKARLRRNLRGRIPDRALLSDVVPSGPPPKLVDLRCCDDPG